MNRADIDATVRRMFGQASQNEIAEACGVDKATVSRRIDALGLRAPQPGLAIDGPIRELWPDLRPEAIAARLGVQVATVKRRATAIGLPPKAPPKPALAVKPALMPLAGLNLRRKLDARIEDAPRLDFAPLPPSRPPGPGALILADAPSRGACRFPVGDAPEGRADMQLFCSAPAVKGCPYCAAHAALAYPSHGKRKSR